jgi:hypothetical protein
MNFFDGSFSDVMLAVGLACAAIATSRFIRELSDRRRKAEREYQLR